MKQENENFLDSRTLIAILLVGGLFVGWQMYMQHKYPDIYSKSATTQSAPAPAGTESGAKTRPGAEMSAGTSAPESAPMAAEAAAQPEKVVHYASDTLSFDISSRGMGIRNVKILKYKTRAGEVVELGRSEENPLPFETLATGHAEPLDFDVKQVNPNLFIGHAHFGGVQITKTLEIIPDKYVLEFKVDAAGRDDRFTGLTTAMAETVKPSTDSSSFLHPQTQMQEFYIDSADSKDRVMFGKDDVHKQWSKVRMASVGSQYFTQAVVDKSSVMPEAKAQLNHAGKSADVLLQYPLLNPGQNFDLSYTAFVGPKSLTLLRDVDESLVRVVDFGFFNWIGRVLLDLLRWFYGLVGNWGLAIILLTSLVRLLVLPVNIYSYKSMRAMQAIQPQLQALREKYKDDQTRQQQETMGLMRSHKVNPVGGCLPMFLQIPVFFALYRVLGNSIELYQAPFGLWIHDLSMKDPFYILPVLMGLAMFLQQKLTPNTMDPSQAKIMLMMPLIFTFFMISLPSGLTLYMLVGSIFSVVQMTYFMKPSPRPAIGSK